ncbi:MAG: SUMF1/EgtB/PvdO family nonheme iron enzyme, partial [Verrucomicrobia bacterium]|nr:SUMF1/EgtB/PvdO family nonheme iron enzyme [Verrucomicrobiota bacterium]
TFSNVYRSGEIEPFVDWAAEGYRLPTEAEWEKAARGGITDTRFPWNDYTNKISHEKAVYDGCAPCYSYDLSTGAHPLYGSFLAPVGSFLPNSYGLYDMAGNVAEWCWDWSEDSYYVSSPYSNPMGPSGGLQKVIRGGHIQLSAYASRCSARSEYPPTWENNIVYANIGFRCVRRAEE